MSLAPPATEPPAFGPAFALLDSEGLTVASSEVFDRWVGAEPLDAPGLLGAVGSVIDDGADTETLALDVGGTSRKARLEPVLSAHGRRLALLEVEIPRPQTDAVAVAEWLGPLMADSDAMVLLKSYDGVHLSVNAAYERALEVTAAAVLGRRDTDLPAVAALDGPRGTRSADPGPTALEYSVPAYDRRPAFAVFRFPVTDRDGAPLVAVFVASRADDAVVARRACEHLLQLSGWLGDEREAIRRTVLADWRISPVRSPTPRPATAPASAPGVPVPAPPEPTGTTGETARPPVVAADAGGGIDLRELVASVAAAGRAAAASTERVIELERELRDTHDELLRERGERAAAQESLQTQLNLANQRFQAELAQLRTRALEAEATRSGLEGRLAQLSDQLATGQREVLELHAALRAARGALTEARGEDDPSPARATVDTAAAERSTLPRLGWTPEAQRGLADGLRGCLNLRSVLSETVRLVGTAGGWDLAAAWVPLAGTTSVAAAGTWVRSPVEMAALETALWQEPQRAPAAVPGVVGASAPTWIDLTAAPADPHLRRLAGAGMATSVIVPVRDEARTVAVIELATSQRAGQLGAADAALSSICAEVAAAARRVDAGAAQSQWGRRR